MRKEVIIAIVAGGILGLIIAFGIWRANIAFAPKLNNKTTTGPTGSPSPKNEFGITIAKPENLGVVTENSITLSGITKPNSWLGVSGEAKDYVTSSKEDGSFEVDVELASGLNKIKITVFDESGTSTSKMLEIVYSSEFAKFLK